MRSLRDWQTLVMSVFGEQKSLSQRWLKVLSYWLATCLMTNLPQSTENNGSVDPIGVREAAFGPLSNVKVQEWNSGDRV